MNNITELRDELCKVFDALRDGTIEVKTAAEMNNTAGKIINSVRVQLEYAEINDAKTKIPFLEN